MRGNSQNGGQTTKSLLTKPQCSGVPIQQAVSLSSSFPRHCLLFVCAFFRKMQAGTRSEELPLPPPPAYKTAPASIKETGAVRLLYGYLFQALTQNLARGLWVSPAYTGKRHTVALCTGRYGDHPRICGEKVTDGWLHVPSIGSPPCARGKGHLTLAVSHMHRITPAYAGKSGSGRCHALWRGDHPRACGEKAELIEHICDYWGLPPRMRGKGVVHVFVTEKFGITPAYAGKRLKRSRSIVPPVAIVPLFSSVCNKPVVSDGSPAGRDAPFFLPAENAAPAPAGPAGSCPASRSSQFPPRIMVISPRP